MRKCKRLLHFAWCGVYRRTETERRFVLQKKQDKKRKSYKRNGRKYGRRTYAIEVHPETTDVAQDRRGEPAV